MIVILTPSKAQKILASNIRERRLSLGLTQAGLSERSGVPLSTLGKFEQTGKASIEALFKIMAIVGGLEEIVEASKPESATFNSIDEVLAKNKTPKRKRGQRS